MPKEEALVRLFSDLDYSRFNAERKRGSKYSALTMILLIVVAGTQGRFSSRQIEEFSLTNTFAAALKYANNEDFDSIVKARQQRIQLQQYPKA